MDTGTFVGIVGILIAVASVIFSILWTRYQSRRSARSTLYVHLSRHFELQPSAYQPDLSSALQLTWNSQPISNVICFGLTLRLEGYHDHDDPSVRMPPPPGAPSPKRPRIDFSNFRILSVGTVDYDPNLFDIPLAKANNDTSLFLNVVRLRAGTEAKFTIIGTKLQEQLPASARLVSGYLKQIDIRGAGLLE